MADQLVDKLVEAFNDLDRRTPRIVTQEEFAAEAVRVFAADRTDRERVRRRIKAALDGEEYSVIEMAADLERLATHPVWEQSEREAVRHEFAQRYASRNSDPPGATDDA